MVLHPAVFALLVSWLQMSRGLVRMSATSPQEQPRQRQAGATQVVIPEERLRLLQAGRQMSASPHQRGHVSMLAMASR